MSKKSNKPTVPTPPADVVVEVLDKTRKVIKVYNGKYPYPCMYAIRGI